MENGDIPSLVLNLTIDINEIGSWKIIEMKMKRKLIDSLIFVNWILKKCDNIDNLIRTLIIGIGYIGFK